MQLMLARMAVGVALSTGPVEMAYIMDFLHSEEELSRVLALQRVMTSAGALAGPLVARSFDKVHFNALCGGVVFINIINLIVGAFLWEDAKAEKAKTLADMDSEATGSDGDVEKNFSESLHLMFSNYSACALLLVSFVYALGFAIGDGPEMVFFKDRYGFGKDQACNFYLLFGSTVGESAQRRPRLMMTATTSILFLFSFSSNLWSKNLSKAGWFAQVSTNAKATSLMSGIQPWYEVNQCIYAGVLSDLDALACCWLGQVKF